MKGLRPATFLAMALAIAPTGTLVGQESSAASESEAEFFESKIHPVLVQRCYSCHSELADKIKGGLRLDSRAALVKGGAGGPVVAGTDAEKSRLIQAIRRLDPDLAMPPKEKDRLTPQQIGDFEAWVRSGLPWSKKSGSIAPSIDLEKARNFWSFKPIQNPEIPAVADRSWPRTPVDHFIQSRHEQKGIRPVGDADRRTLLRRATFDLTGLPPTPEEVDAFMADTAPDAFEKLVDRLLASPRYGERWGRHWLDVVRYADTAGDGADYPIPQAHKYRDYVIDAFNKDKPYDQFVREQVAGDLLVGGTDQERFERIIATGFIAISRRSGEDPDKEPHITIDDTIDTLGSAVLGLNLGCARCHDHKFDPIPKEDYYALYGIFQSTKYAYAGSDHKKYQRDFVPLLPREEAERIAKPFDEKLAALEAELEPLAEEAKEFEKALGGMGEQGDGKGPKRSVKEFKDAIQAAFKKCTEFGKTRPDYPDAYAVSEGKPANARVHLAGNPEKLGAEVPRGFLQVLGGQKVTDVGSGRRQLAEWLTDRRNPLTARVMANRIWQGHFGRGLVGTPNVFGKRGMAPSNPELLEFLATRLIESGWSVKSMHRLIMNSRVYQLAGREDAAAARLDPANTLHWRFERQRLEAEALRDSLLAVSGRLSLTMGGAHPFGPRNSWKYDEAAPFRADFSQGADRRSVYLVQPRLVKNPVLALFDGADPNLSVGKRFESTTPVQALYMMNSSFVHEQARAMAARLQHFGTDDRARVDLAHRLLFGRPALREEIEEALAYLKRMAVALPSAADGIPRQRDMLVQTAHEDPVRWRYTFANPGEGWETKDFKDGAWKDGSAGFAPEKIIREPAFMVRTVWNSPEIWMRRTFALPHHWSSTVRLRAFHDGDAEIYVNGLLAAELKGKIEGFRLFEIRGEALRSLHHGDNLLSVHCAKTGKGQFIDVGMVEQKAADFENEAAWASYLRVLMSSNEFMYVD